MKTEAHQYHRSVVYSYYLVFGLRLRVNQSLPRLLPITPSAEAEVEMRLHEWPDWLLYTCEPEATPYHVSPDKDDDGAPNLRIFTVDQGRYFHFLYNNGATFLLKRDGTEVWAYWPDSLTPYDIAIYLLGPILGFLLRLRGQVCLHASAVVVGQQAVALLGPSGAGKSTTAAAFANRGYPILSDDIVTLRNERGALCVQPGYPGLRLWPEAVEAFYGHEEILPPLAPGWTKRYLDLTSSGYCFQSCPLPLAAIYTLDERTRDPVAPAIIGVGARSGLVSLVENSRNELASGEMRRREFPVFARLASTIPIRRLNAHSSASRFPMLCEAILDDFMKLQSQAKESRA